MSFEIYILQAIAFLDLLAVGLIVPLVPIKLRKLGGNEIYVGLLGSIYAGSQLISGPVIGSLSDVKGRKPVLAITLLISSLSYICLGIIESIIVILILRALLGIFKQTQMLTKALVPDYEENQSEQVAIHGKMAAISGVGITLGPIIGGHIAEAHYELSFIALIVGIIFAINAGLVFLLPTIQKHSKRKKAKVAETNMFLSLYSSLEQSIVELYHIQWSKYWTIFLFKALVGFAMSVYYSNYALYLRSQYQLSPKYIGYVIAFQGVIGSISSYYMGYINSFYLQNDNYCLCIFHIFIVLSVALLGLLTSFNVFVYTFWLIPLAIGNAAGRLVTLEMVLKMSRAGNKGALIGASNSIRSLTGVIAPMVAGVITEYVGVSYVIYASLFSTTLGIFLSYWHKRKQKED